MFPNFSKYPFFDYKISKYKNFRKMRSDRKAFVFGISFLDSTSSLTPNREASIQSSSRPHFTDGSQSASIGLLFYTFICDRINLRPSITTSCHESKHPCILLPCIGISGFRRSIASTSNSFCNCLSCCRFECRSFW
jgi:hypothetical protein